MAILTGLFRLGRDGELRHTPNGDAVVNLSLAYNYGMKPKDGGSKPTQWIDAALWGKLAEVLAPYLLKGGQIDAVISDLHIETFNGKNGESYKLAGKILQIELAGGGKSADAPRAEPQKTGIAPIGNYEDDIPF
jgi:single-strand DNA-binding protein